MIETTKNMTGNNSTSSTKKSIQDEIASFLVSSNGHIQSLINSGYTPCPRDVLL